MISCESASGAGNSYRLSVHATPGAKREHVGGEHDGALRVSVTAAADKGKANDAITKLLAVALEIKPRQISLHSGATNRRKVFLISDATDQITSRVARLARGE